LVVALAAGCGGEGDATPTTSTSALNAAVASRLADASDRIAEALDQNDVCTAAGRADELKDAVVQAINAGEVPPAFQEDLLARTNELVNEVNCPQPEPTTTEEEKPKKKDKKKDKNEDQQNETVPTDTGTIVTDTVGG
jgi:hypothetical protein